MSEYEFTTEVGEVPPPNRRISKWTKLKLWELKVNRFRQIQMPPDEVRESLGGLRAYTNRLGKREMMRLSVRTLKPPKFKSGIGAWRI